MHLMVSVLFKSLFIRNKNIALLEVHGSQDQLPVVENEQLFIIIL